MKLTELDNGKIERTSPKNDGTNHDFLYIFPKSIHGEMTHLPIRSTKPLHRNDM